MRAGGKHNDLDNVGYTARHHTFFEMLGNFSFGDYFKERAIPLAWELVTKDFGLDAKQLLVTVYHDDEEAYGIWKKVTGFSDDKIIRIATSDNFWRDGRHGSVRAVLGDLLSTTATRSRAGRRAAPDADGDRFIEIWNLVFMQYEQRGARRARRRCRSRRSTPAWAWSASRPCCRACTTTTRSISSRR